mgnify:CR=1 FL=1
MSRGAWDETNVREASSVRAWARQNGATVRFARIAELCHENGSELKEEDPPIMTKGRCIPLSAGVTDLDFNWAQLAELGSSPPYMEAARALDALGSLPVKTGDARGAYTQSFMHGAEAWVTLLKNR